MSYEFILWGDLVFPSSEAIAAWRSTAVDPHAYSDWDQYFGGKPGPASETVEEVFSEYIDEVTLDGSMCYFLILDEQRDTVRIRGLVHRDGFDRVFLSAFRCASLVSARGDLYFEHSMAGGRYHLHLAPDATAFEETEETDDSDSKMIDCVMSESIRRAAKGQTASKKKKPRKKKKA